MQCSKHLVIVFVISALTAATPVPPGTSTARSPAQIGETLKQLTNQLMDTNTTSEIITLDTRTPPKIKQHAKKKIKPESMENSHAGVAIPVNEDEVLLEQTTKKLNFYKIEKPTTNSGLSTWILLSGQTTPKPSRKPLIKPNESQNSTILVETHKISRPVFKKRPSSTTTPLTTTTTMMTTILTKVKASALNVTKKATTTTTPSTTTSTEVTTVGSTSSSTTTNSSSLPVEAKDGETELSNSTTEEKKTRRPSNKRKKNKNRRRRPSEKSDNENKIDKPLKAKEKPIGTQLYNYLSREVMPTVGVGLVGLVVTAGLASYFLYPFGIARRSYDIDRKDNENSYYYDDSYSGGIAEEEAIGKVIAGMPSNSIYGNSFKTPTSRHSFNNRRVEQSTTYNLEDITPAVVPEHGPRSLKLRKRRQVPSVPNFDSIENEIDGTMSTSDTTTQPPVTTTYKISTTTSDTRTTTHKTSAPDKFRSIVDMVKELFHLKVNLGLQLLQNATQAVSKYVSHVQRRLDQHYRNYTLNQ